MTKFLNKYFFYRQISFLNLLIVSTILNTFLIYTFYYLNDKVHLSFLFEGDWRSSWESILDKTNFHTTCNDFGICKLKAPYPLAYLLRYLELNFQSSLYAAIIIYSLLMSLMGFYIQKIINLVNKKYSFICMIYFLFSPTSFVVIATFYKESYFVVSLLSVFLSLISFYLFPKVILNQKLFYSFLYFIFSIFLMYISRPVGTHLITFLTLTSFIIYIVVNFYIKYEYFWKILWIKAMYVFIAFIFSLNMFTEGIGYFKNNKAYKIPINISFQIFTPTIISHKEVSNISNIKNNTFDKEEILKKITSEIADETITDISQNIHFYKDSLLVLINETLDKENSKIKLNEIIETIDKDTDMVIVKEKIIKELNNINEKKLDLIKDQLKDNNENEFKKKLETELSSNQSKTIILSDKGIGELNPINFAKTVTHNQKIDAGLYGDNDTNSTFFRDKGINLFGYIYYGLIAPNPITIIKSIFDRATTNSVVQFILIIEIVFFYFCLFFLLMNLFKKNNYIMLILVIFSLEIIFVIVSFDSYIGTLIRHRFLPWKLINIFGLIFLIEYLVSFKKNA